jgi:hypothetical protein
MRLVRGLLGALLWILGAVIGLVGVVLCVTVILLPLGIPLVKLAGRLLSRAVQLMLPRMLVHPVDELTTTAKKKSHKAGSAVSDTAGDAAKKGRKAVRKERKRIA